MLPSPLFFPPPTYHIHLELDPTQTWTMEELCRQAQTPCRASGAWIHRRVAWQTASELSIAAQPSYTGDVLISVPHQVVRHGQTAIARYLLQVLAYSQLFDGVARESVRGVEWARNIAKPGRPPTPFAKSNAQRQREWRNKKRTSALASAPDNRSERNNMAPNMGTS